MNTKPLDHAIGATALADLLLAVPRVLKNWRRALRHRREIAELTQLDDRMLADIGITRQDVQSALSAPVLTDPSQALICVRRDRRHPTWQRRR